MNWKVFQQPYPLEDSIKRAMITAFGFGLFVGLFLIVFQPFGLTIYQAENKNLILSGYGLVTAFCLLGNFLIFKTLFPIWYSETTWTVGKNILYTLWMFFCIGLGNLLYSLFQNFLDLSFGGFLFYQSMTLMVGTMPVIFSTLLVYNKRLAKAKIQAEGLNETIHSIQKSTHQLIEIPSLNKSEFLKIETQQLLYIQSTENYVEVYYEQEGEVKKEVLRNTLKNLNEFFKEYPSIQKCHRSFLVNLNRVNHFSGNAQGLTLEFEGQSELSIPVSRAFVKEIKTHLV